MSGGQTIRCPKCGTAIEMTAALRGEIERSLEARYAAAAAVKDAEIATRLAAVGEREKAVEARRGAVETEVTERLAGERKKLADAALVKARAEEAEGRKALEAELAERGEKLKRAQAEELSLRRQQRELEQEKEALELTVQRKLDEERKKIAAEAQRTAAEAQELKMREKDDLVGSLRKQVEDMQRKMEQGSQERQGEMMEDALKDVLQRRFPYDRFEDVAKGSRGADIVQVVCGPTGKVCGKILWESKNTKEFARAWTEKLKKDQLEAGADVAVLMTAAMPREVRDFDLYDDVYVTNYRCAIGLCTALREGLIKLTRQRAVDAGHGGMKDVVYEYVTGPEFSRRIKIIVTAYTQMQSDLQSEQRAMMKIWKRREKQIGAVLQSAAEMRGEIEGLVSGYKVLPNIEELMLEGLVEDEGGGEAEAG